MRPFATALVLVIAVVVAGCASPTPPPAATAPLAPPVVPVPVHVVLVGAHPDLDRATLLDGLPTGSQASLTVQSQTTGERERIPYVTAATWTLHEAPAAFADALFATIEASARPAAPTDWLVTRDAVSGENRLCTVCRPPVPEPAPATVNVVDGPSVSLWLADNRAAHGLQFEPHAATVFLLDHFTDARLATDTYWQYAFLDGTGISITRTMRAWGGEADLVFLDRSAAPSSFDIEPWRVIGEDDRDGVDGRADPPIWELAGDTATATANVRHHLRDFYHLRAAREPLYAPHAVDRIDVKTYFIIDEGATLNANQPAGQFLGKGGVDLFDAADIKRAFATLAPWVEWNVDLVTINLPDDDPALADAMRQAKAEGAGAIDLGVLQAYFRGTLDTYAPSVENGRTYPLAFLVTNAATAASPIGFRGGVALGNERGASLVAYASFGDASVCPTRLDHVVCFFEDQSDDAGAFYTNYITHEIGHNLALRHPHDREGDEEWAAYRANSLWDSTLTAMTYRHWGSDFDAFDRRYYATHTAALRLAAAPAEHPNARELHGLLEAGRLEEAGRFAVDHLPVARDPHDRPVVPDAALDSVATDVTVTRAEGEARVPFTVPDGTQWTRVRLDGTASLMSFSFLEDASGSGFSYGDANHRDTHLFGLQPSASYAVVVNGEGALAVTVDFFATDPKER